MFKDKSIRTGVISSIIASAIFLAFFQPILQFVWRILTVISYKTYAGYTDSIYRNAALGQRNWLDLIMLTWLYSIIILIAVGAAIKGWSYWNEKPDNEEKFLNEILNVVNLKSSISSNNQSEEVKIIKEQIDSIVQSKQEEINLEIAKLNNQIKVIYILQLLVSICLMVCLLSSIFSAYCDLQLNTSFNQRVTVLSPYIKDEEIKILKSEWALMKNRSDFEKIDKEVESLAIQYKISLPPKLLD